MSNVAKSDAVKSIEVSVANFMGRRGEEVAYMAITVEGAKNDIRLTPSAARAIAANIQAVLEVAGEAEAQAKAANQPKQRDVTPPAAPTRTPPAPPSKNPPVALDESVVMQMVLEQIKKNPDAIRVALDAMDSKSAETQPASSLQTAIASRPKRRAKG